MGKKPRREHFERITAVDDDVLQFIARHMAEKHGLRAAAVALLHATNLHQRKIGEILSLDHSTVSRRLKEFLGVYRRVSGGSRVVDTEENAE